MIAYVILTILLACQGWAAVEAERRRLLRFDTVADRAKRLVHHLLAAGCVSLTIYYLSSLFA